MATLYVTQAGSGAGDGTSGNPMSVAAFNALTLVPGNTYNFSGTITSTIIPITSGTSGNLITLDGTSASVTNNNTSYYWLDLTNRQYIVGYGFSVDGQGYYNNSNINRGVALVNSQYCKIDTVTMTRMNGYGMFRFENAHYNEIVDCTISYVGYWDVYQITPADGHDDRGDGIDFDFLGVASTHNKIHGCTIQACGHAGINPRPAGTTETFNVFENNTLIGEWEQYTGATFDGPTNQGYVVSGETYGNRCADMGNVSRTLIQGNLFLDTRMSVDNRWIGALKLGYKKNIVRKNYFSGSNAGPFILHTTSEQSGYTATDNGNNRIYNNSFYGASGPILQIEKYDTNGNGPVSCRLKNNASYLSNQVTQFDRDTYYVAGTPISTRRQTTVCIYGGYNKYGDNWFDIEVSGNCIDGNGSATNQTVYSDQSGAISLTAAESSYSSEFHDNVQDDPLFTTLPARAPVHFELQTGSPAIAAGDNLTTAVGSGSSSTSLTVADASYFVDPTNWYWITTGDEIQIGTNSSNRATITDINYSTNVITLDTALSWSDSDGVNLAEFMENGSLPDIGARPYGGALTPISATDDSFSVDMDSAEADVDVLANDIGSGISITAVRDITDSGATVSVKTGNAYLRFAPPTSYTGLYVLEYDITDGTYTDTATATINVINTSLQSSQDIVFKQDSGSDKLVVIEAEHYSRNIPADSSGHTWDKITDAAYSNLHAMKALPDTGTNNTSGYAPSVSPRLDYEIDFVTTGTHYIWFRLKDGGVAGDSDSVHFGLDGNTVANAEAASVIDYDYSLQWSNLNTSAAVLSISIGSTGRHTLNMWMREDGTLVDKIVLTTNASYTRPTGSGPAESVYDTSTINFVDQLDGESSNTAFASHTADLNSHGGSKVFSGTSATVLADGTGLQFGAAGDRIGWPTGTTNHGVILEFTPNADNRIACLIRGDESGENGLYAIARIGADSVQFHKRVSDSNSLISQTSYTFDTSHRYLMKSTIDSDDLWSVYIIDQTTQTETLIDSFTYTEVQRGGYNFVYHETRTDGTLRLHKVATLSTDSVDNTAPTAISDLSGTVLSATRIQIDSDTDAVNTSIASGNLARVRVDGGTFSSSDVFADNISSFPYDVTGLTADTEYTITVEMIDAVTNISTASNSVVETTDASADTTAPAIPTNLSFVSQDVSGYPYYATVSWTDPTDADLEYIYVYLDGNLEAGATIGKGIETASIRLFDTSAHTITVSAVDYTPNESEQSDGITVQISPEALENANRVKRDALLTLLSASSGQLNDLDYKWFAYLLTETGHISGLYRSYLTGKGYWNGHIQSSMYNYLGSLGYTGTLDERLKDAWSAGEFAT